MFKHEIEMEIELKLLEIDHAEEIFKSINSNREHLRDYLPWVDETKSIEDTKEFIKHSKNQYINNEGFDAGIWYEGKYVGMIGFHSLKRRVNSISIGYWIDENFTGKGIVTNACKQFINYAFEILKMNRVEITCAEDNLKSRAIPERLEFIEEGIIRDGELRDGTYVGLVVYGMLKREWNR